MPFPVTLSPSPVSEVFSGIQENPLEKLALSDPEKSLLRAAEENPLEYTLNDHKDAESYALLLLKVIDLTLSSSEHNKNSRVYKLSLDQSLSDDEAHQLLFVDFHGVWLHYAISKFSEVIIALKSTKKTNSTIANTFFPSGLLLEDWRILHRVLSATKSDPFAQRGAAFCLACILYEGCLLEERCQLFSSLSSILRNFVTWITFRLQSATSPTFLAAVTPSMTIILEIKKARLLFIDNGGLNFLSRHLHTSDKDPNDLPRKAGASVQQLYELTYCLWLPSFDCCDHHSLRKHFHRDGAVPALVDLVAAATREKITRLALSTLRNLATFHTSEDSYDALAFRTEMIGCGLLTRLERLKEAAKWNDPDMIDDIDILEGHLQQTFRHMTRWDLYQAEVESSHLQWGVLHTEKFFRENIKLFEGDDGQFKIIHDLVRLTSSEDEEIASLACFDLGEFVRHYPNGRLLASRLGARDAVMALIDHSHEELQKQALLAVSKMLIQNWKAVE
ncbi:hypothetical protein FisN_34Hh008 [Fistulifera solaris]|uniref:ATPase V1 complex subunit H C-terminal domain-containing protein n=1 Tax=Fistulifera solaris TaxID=1519565 RepID=A0A1Z5KS93_FISSO|nr:hypothetical protein FisN_34Hh008 [Fistulifera solaris]|eukprot:GAX28798.1 hypothetical protein FisN_34Hh008 [Fistulifera solaris]